MKGFKPTGYGPSAGFKFPQRMGFSGSTGAYTNVSPYVRRKFANGGAVRGSDPGGSTVNRKKTYAEWQKDTGSTSSLLPGYSRGGALRHSKKPTKKADGGMVKREHLPRRPRPYTLGESVAAIPALLGSGPAFMKRSVKDAAGRVMNRAQKDVADMKRRRIDSIVEGDLASKYAKGGKAKRMGYAKGGNVNAQRDLSILKGYHDRKPDMRESAQRVADHISSPNHRVNLKKTRTVKPAFAGGGAISAAEAKKIAERTVGEHVRYPAPKGHQGLEKVMPK